MRRRLSLRTQPLMWQLVIVLFVVTATMGTALAIQWMQLRDAYVERALGIAHSVAELPAVREAFDDPDPEQALQPIAELIRGSADMTYVVVTDGEGIRYSHPNPDRIGSKVSTDPSIALSGRVFTGKENGTLGPTWRAKVPVFASNGAVVGQVSVGIRDSELWHDVFKGAPWQLAVTGLVAAVSGVGAILTARIFHKRTLGLEPEQIAGLLQGREAILHGARDGIVAVDLRQRVVLVNDAAREMLGVEGGYEGARAADILDASLAAQLVEADGEEQLRLVAERRVITRADPVAHESQRVGHVLIVRDHTELHRTITELEGAHSMAEQLQTQTHEFQNQLHVIGGLLQIGDTAAAQAFVKRLGQGGALPVLQAPAEARGPDNIDPELAALLLAKHGAARELRIRFDHDGLEHWPGLLEASTQTRDDLLTIVGNLVDNAFDATGGAVELRLQRSGNQLHIFMDDSGPGVPDALRELIFTAGVTTKTSGTAHGFGLPLVRTIATRMHGQVTVATSHLGGARFALSVELPTSTNANPDAVVSEAE